MPPTSQHCVQAETYHLAASQLLRALRGKRSQVALSRRLGYQANPITDWENGRRYPTIFETLRAASKVHLDYRDAFASFLPTSSRTACFEIASPETIAAWLRELRGSMKMSDLTARTGRTRYSVARWLSGETEQRLPEFLLLVDVLTGRVQDWVSALVPIQDVPVLADRAEKAAAARRLALEHPDTALLLRILETERGTDSVVALQRAAHILHQSPEQITQWVDELERVGVLVRVGGRLSIVSELTVSTNGTPEQRRDLRLHWAAVAQRRLQEGADSDWFAYNLIAVSKEDSIRIEERLRAAYREVRAIVADSKPEEVAALLTMHLVRFEE